MVNTWLIRYQKLINMQDRRGLVLYFFVACGMGTWLWKKVNWTKARRYYSLGPLNFTFVEVFTIFRYSTWWLISIKGHNLLSYFLLSEKFRKCFILLPTFYLVMWLMKSPKSFEKIAIFKIWQLVFIWGVKTYFGILPLKWWNFRHEKKGFDIIGFDPIKI